MAPRDPSSKPKKRTRKTRTADPISSSDTSDLSSSDSESTPPPQQPATKKSKPSEPKSSKASKSPAKAKSSKTKKPAPSPSPSASRSPSPDTEIPAAARDEIAATRLPSTVAAEEAFTTYYLRQITTNFADDLEKIRGASDFKAGSLPMLIEALRQGRACFGESERVTVGRAVLAAAESTE